jgi:hypothetical protein
MISEKVAPVILVAVITAHRAPTLTLCGGAVWINMKTLLFGEFACPQRWNQASPISRKDRGVCFPSIHPGLFSFAEFIFFLTICVAEFVIHIFHIVLTVFSSCILPNTLSSSRIAIATVGDAFRHDNIFPKTSVEWSAFYETSGRVDMTKDSRHMNNDHI